jgi:Kef-type K+ transport system membrane component KefB
MRDAFILLADLGAVVLAARAAGALARHIGQPVAVGAIAAGIVLGPTLLAAFPMRSVADLRPYGNAGLVAFAFLIGLEFDRARLPALRAVSAIAASSFALPFCGGIVVAAALDDGDRASRSGFFLFVASAMSITAFPVLVRILDDSVLRTTRTGVLAVACAVVNDLFGWLTLAAALAVFRSDGHWWRLALTVIEGMAFLVVLTWLVGPLLGVLSRRGTASFFVFSLCGLAGSAVMTDAVGLHSVFGAFAFGAVVRRYVDEGAYTKLAAPARTIASVLLPVYLALPGLGLDLRVLGAGATGTTALITGVASIGKLAGAYGAARLFGVARGEAVTLGILLNTRGLMELIALNVGLSAGIVDVQLYAMFLVMALATTAATGPALWLLAWLRREAPSSAMVRL